MNRIHQGTAFWFPFFDNEGYLYFSAGERRQSLSIHTDITRDNGKFTASMRMEEFLQTILVGKPVRKKLFIPTASNPQG
jgi:DUF1365 family protein